MKEGLQMVARSLSLSQYDSPIHPLFNTLVSLSLCLSLARSHEYVYTHTHSRGRDGRRDGRGVQRRNGRKVYKALKPQPGTRCNIVGL